MKVSKYITIVLAALTLGSCELNKEPYGASSFWTSEGEAQRGLNAIYAPLYEEEGYGRGHWWFGAASDDMIINSNKTADLNMTEFNATTNTSSGNYNNWKYMYRVIKRANDVIANVPQIKMSEDKKKQFIGEAHFMAAFAYFHLAKRYGGLPYYDYTKPEETNKPRETKEQTYKNIEAHLKNAIANYEELQLWVRSDADWGRPNLGAMHGLLAKVYAHWGKFDLAKAESEKVITRSEYELAPSFKKLFSVEGEKSSEVLYNLANKEGMGDNSTVASIITISKRLSGGKGWNYFPPTQSLVNAFEAGDERRTTTFVGPGDKFGLKDNLQDITSENIGDLATGYMCVKFSQNYLNMSVYDWRSGNDQPLLRLSDVYLIYAESVMQLAGANYQNRNTEVPAAAEALNKVRRRAFGVTDNSKDLPATFQNLMDERRRELAYEDERHYDLVRWGAAKDVYAAATTATDPRGARVFVPGTHDHFPIPQSEIDNTDGLLINNPAKGYSSFE
ncbi:MAG: RagB/SusD family nutrient uptake outer membrane protein [Bacteroidales bacterium]